MCLKFIYENIQNLKNLSIIKLNILLLILKIFVSLEIFFKNKSKSNLTFF
jgi:hypothetical protein